MEMQDQGTTLQLPETRPNNLPGRLSAELPRSPGLSRLLLAASNLAQVGPVYNENFRLERTESDACLLRLNISKIQNEGLGFSIMEGPEKNSVYVAYVLEDTSAMLNGLLPNDQILEINEESISHMDRHAAAVYFRSLPLGPVNLKVRRSQEIHSESLPYYLAKHTGLTTGATGMYETMYGGFFGRSKIHLPMDRSKSILHAESQLSVPSLAAKVNHNGANRVTEVITVDSEAQIRDTSKSTGKFATRLASLPYFIIFAIEALTGLAIIVIECVTGGLFPSVIGGEEYAGIYVGAFGIATGVTGLISASVKVAQDYELKLHLVNMVMNIICMVQALILGCASAALLARHVHQESAYWTAQSQNTTSVTNDPDRVDRDVSALIGLKSTALVLYFVLFAATCAFLLLITAGTRRRMMSSRSLRFMKT